MKLSTTFISLILVALLAGCADTGVKRRYVWPLPPNEPKIEWLGAYESQLDFPQTTFRLIRELFVGSDNPVFFVKPIDIRSDGRGKVYVLDQGRQRVYIYNFAEYEIQFLMDDGGGPELRRPAGIAVDKEGSLYLLDAAQGKIHVFASDERYIKSLDIRGVVKRPVSIAYDRRNNRLLVCDTALHQLHLFDSNGKLLFSIGKPGSQDAEFSYPVAAAVTINGDIVVADAMNARIQIFDANGDFIRKFGSRGDGPSDFQIIKGVAVDSDYNIYVTEGRTSRVLIFSQRGDFLFSLGGQYFTAETGKTAPGGFMLPQGIDIDEHDTIYVVDQLNQRFQVFKYLKNSK